MRTHQRHLILIRTYPEPASNHTQYRLQTLLKFFFDNKSVSLAYKYSYSNHNYEKLDLYSNKHALFEFMYRWPETRIQRI